MVRLFALVAPAVCLKFGALAGSVEFCAVSESERRRIIFIDDVRQHGRMTLCFEDRRLNKLVF